MDIYWLYMPGVFKNKHYPIEPIWHIQLAMLIAIGLQLLLPDRFAIGSRYVLPFVELVLLGLLTITTPRQRIFKSLARTTNVVLLIVIASFANVYSLVVIMNHLLMANISDGKGLLLSAINIYVTNIIIFGLWYYEMDGGGPGRRKAIEHYEHDFIFTQQRNGDYRHPDWHPYFTDYVYASATNAMTFGPTETFPLTRRAKLLMLLQSSISLAAIAIVAARAIGILQ